MVTLRWLNAAGSELTTYLSSVFFGVWLSRDPEQTTVGIRVVTCVMLQEKKNSYKYLRQETLKAVLWPCGRD